ncbi:S26 family signal peptidase [Dactylosporangium fulvum]|uniref:signal peptidase I n=1 Tax=Dactylosporangium fulvum TaxID=53359 RepID=A0ABY5VT39_9ACTN|nr:S26 family signal peptidase [Dactylosporangium fulvum]UWP80319.1 S26 family signal peptidase [Dactylosporangium fulvum]
MSRAARLFARAIGVLRQRWLLVTVEGVSMAPTYLPGDRLLVRRTTLAGVRRGAVVLLRSPGAGLAGDPPFMLKRAVALPGDPVPAGIPVAEAVVPSGRLVVLGDNAEHSADSRSHGFQPADAVAGVVLAYRPARPRSGPVRPADGLDQPKRSFGRSLNN